MTDGDWNLTQAVGMQQQGNQERLFVRFSMEPVQNQDKTLEEGRPIFEDSEHIEIMVPGDKSTIVFRPIRADDKQRFAAQYAAWKQGTQDVLVGTPLKEWPGMTRSQVEELAYQKVRTVEELANLSDGVIARLGPILALRQKARDYIERAKLDAPAEKLRVELAERDSQMAAMRRQLEELAEQVKQSKQAKK